METYFYISKMYTFFVIKTFPYYQLICTVLNTVYIYAYDYHITLNNWQVNINM